MIDEHGWWQRDPISDKECILLCLRNCTQMCGVDRKQVERIIKELESES